MSKIAKLAKKMRCQSSKFLLISIVTFAVAVAVVQIWQGLKPSADVDVTRPDLIENFSVPNLPISNNQTRQMSCAEIESRSGGFAQDKRAVNAGVLNGKSCMMEPVYPPTAITKNIDGQVNVEVLVDGFGKVKTAKAISGNPILHKSAVKAALKTQVCPTLLGNEPMIVKGLLIYKFILPNP